VSAAAPDNLRGAALLALSTVAFTADVTVVRLAGPEATQGQIILFRALGQLLLSLIVLRRAGWGGLATTRRWLHVVRGLVSLAIWGLYYLSFRLLDFALATTLTFATSLFVVALAGPVLGERVGAARWTATLAGFGGVVLATGVGFGAPPSLGVLVGMLAAAGGALIVLLNRVLSRTERTVTIMSYIGLVAVAGAAPAAALDWRPLAAETAGLLAAAGLLGACGMWLTIEAYRVGEASALAPIPYLRLVLAVLVGAALFAEPPDPPTLLGAGIVAAASFAIARREAALRRARARAP
jgi:drug/metabolite transporter (DMT)-like permease